MVDDTNDKNESGTPNEQLDEVVQDCRNEMQEELEAVLDPFRQDADDMKNEKVSDYESEAESLAYDKESDFQDRLDEIMKVKMERIYERIGRTIVENLEVKHTNENKAKENTETPTAETSEGA